MTYILRRGTPAAQNVAAQLSGPSLAHLLGQDEFGRDVLSRLLIGAREFSLVVASAILIESGLSFLGLGVVPPEPSWGLMIRSARGTMEHNACVRVAEVPALRTAGSA